MKSNIVSFSVVFLFTALISSLFFASSVNATVGGPTYVYSLKYNPADESVYYTQVNGGGRGCPPELWKISLNTGKRNVVFSCDQGEALQTATPNSDSPLVNIEIERITENFKDLTQIHIPNNAIDIDLTFTREEILDDKSDWVIRTDFSADIYEDGTLISELTVSGCSKEQPFVFAGYAIPGFDKKIILLQSAKGDCWEGGYIYESLHVVGGLNNLDKAHVNGSYKTREPLVPNEATLVVFERDVVTNDAAPTSTTTPSNHLDKIGDYPLIHLLLAGLLGVLIGFVLARIAKKTVGSKWG